jgi:hypothetical protein
MKMVAQSYGNINTMILTASFTINIPVSAAAFLGCRTV